MLLGTTVACDGSSADEPGEASPGGNGSDPGSSQGPVVPRGYLFAEPVPDRYDDAETHSSVQVLRRMIEATPAGETIRLEAQSVSLTMVAEDLVTASERGVHVQIVTRAEGLREGWKGPQILQDGLGEDTRADSFVHFARGGLHEKIWSFSKVGRVRDVVLVGSMNLTYQSAGQYTDVTVYRGRPDVRRVANRRFAQTLRQLPRVRSVPPVRMGADTWWFYPLADPSLDPVQQVLDRLPPQGTRMRVVMYAWRGDRGHLLAGRLVALAQAGADVEAVLGPYVRDSIRDQLAEGGVRVHSGEFDGFDHVHLKVLTVDRAGAGGRRRFVMTGADNWTDGSFDMAQLLVRRDGPRAYAAYDRFVDRIISRSKQESS